jgi:hypothetical protein
MLSGLGCSVFALRATAECPNSRALLPTPVPLFKGESPNPRPIVRHFRRRQQIDGRAIEPSIAWFRRPISEGEQVLVIVAQQVFGAEANAAQTCSVGNPNGSDSSN